MSSSTVLRALGQFAGAQKREGLVPWCERNPQVQVRAEIRSGRHLSPRRVPQREHKVIGEEFDAARDRGLHD